MSYQYGKVLSLILYERFGELVEQVAGYLFKSGPCSLLHVRKSTDLPLLKIKDALSVLIKYGLVSFKNSHGVTVYILFANKVVLMLRYPIYIKLIKRKFGDEAEILIEEVLQKGYIEETELLSITLSRLKKDTHETSHNLSFMKEKLNSLIIAKYLVKFSTLFNDESNEAPMENKDDTLSTKLSEQQKEQVGNYWTVNFDRFHQDMRDDLIVTSFTKKFDANVGELIRILLQQMYVRTEPWAETSNPVPILEVKDIVKKMNTFPQLALYFEQYVTVLEQDTSHFILKVGEASGGSFQLCMKDIFTKFVWEIVEQIVLEKFDSKAARIFRLVKKKSYVEPDQIQKLAMIPAKEAKRLSYQLVEENFFHIQELKKASSANVSGPNKSFVLFHIQLDNLVRTILELCYKSLFNAMTRRSHCKYLNKRIIDKKQRVDTILMSMRSQGASAEQLLDIEEMLTPPEKEIYEKIENSIKKLNLLEIEIDQTIFFLELYLTYH